jgi:hypothetical protein
MTFGPKPYPKRSVTLVRNKAGDEVIDNLAQDTAPAPRGRTGWPRCKCCVSICRQIDGTASRSRGCASCLHRRAPGRVSLVSDY